MCNHGRSGVFPVSSVPRTELSKYNKLEIEGRSGTCWYCNLNTVCEALLCSVFTSVLSFPAFIALQN